MTNGGLPRLDSALAGINPYPDLETAVLSLVSASPSRPQRHHVARLDGVGAAGGDHARFTR
jgi:hypothetical protein